jgi:inosine/xanthosine triphosphate pyrophosphatase family protein
MSELITRQVQGKAARAHAEQIAKLERERDAAIRVCEMNATSGAFNARWAENAQKRAEAAEGQVAELEAENARLAAFARQIIEYAFDGQDADGGSIQALAVHHGLLRETKYDPKEHGPSFATPGDEWFVCVGAVAKAPVE